MQELRGMPVVKALFEKCLSDVAGLSCKGIVPKLAIVRIGASEDDLAYEKEILKRFSAANADAEVIALPLNVTQDQLGKTILSLNEDSTVHGILIFRPLTKHLSEEPIKTIIADKKDVDSLGTINMARIFAGNISFCPPCTAQAVVELLDFYGIDVTGKKVVIVGRSLVVGKPLAMMLLGKNATVTICHTKTVDLDKECKRADILIACAGMAKLITDDFVNPHQIVIDVRINMSNGSLCGDVDYESVAPLVKAITPVPGGVGTITTTVLLKHTIRSAMGQVISPQ